MPVTPTAAPQLVAPTHTSVADELNARYSFPVETVTTPPPAVYLLARLEEQGAPDCAASLKERARRLGANQLYIEPRSETCRGAAYVVKPMLAAVREDPVRAAAENYGPALDAWLRARWHPPPGVSDAALRPLCVVTRVWTSSERRIWKVLGTAVRPSGNAKFDDSVRATLELAIDEHATLPEPRTLTLQRGVRGAIITLAFSPGGFVSECK